MEDWGRYRSLCSRRVVHCLRRRICESDVTICNSRGSLNSQLRILDILSLIEGQVKDCTMFRTRVSDMEASCDSFWEILDHHLGRGGRCPPPGWSSSPNIPARGVGSLNQMSTHPLHPTTQHRQNLPHIS